MKNLKRIHERNQTGREEEQGAELDLGLGLAAGGQAEGQDEGASHNFKNPFAVIQAAVDLLNKDPDNLEKVRLAIRIINQQATKISNSLSNRLERNLEEA